MHNFVLNHILNLKQHRTVRSFMIKTKEKLGMDENLKKKK